MSGDRLIALSIPFFFLLIGAELLVARARRRRVYRLADAVGDLGCGMAQQLVLVFAGAALLAAYAWLFDHHRLLTLDAATPAPWLVSFVAVDFLYYWWHRASHRVNLLWAAHVVHHQSEDFNLAVALRQAIATSFTSLPFYLPMALLGVPPPVYATMVALSTLYQFWIHTELVGRLGPLEWILNTPSHHRVHHAVNPEYLDKNYAAVLIVWDRLFGTFAGEQAAPVYGTVKPFRSFNAVWAQLAYLGELWQKAAGFPRWRDRVRLLLMPPPWQPAGAPAEAEPEVRGRAKHDPPLSAGRRWYAVLQLAPAVVATTLALWYRAEAPRALLAAAALLVFWTLASLGGLLDRRRWAVPAEVGRVVVVAAGLVIAALR
jgi:sterol desaturase/sphingolipid hydroxylase (fatty acid hydroxylase superfamily)